MSNIEIIGIVVAIFGLTSFSIIFTVLYSNYSKSLVKECQDGKRDIELIDEAVYDNLAHIKNRRKIIKTIKSIGFYGLMIIIIPFFIIAVITKFSNNITVFDKGIIVVATGSMSEKHEDNDYLLENNLNNQFDAYEIIVLEKIESDSELKLYDVISYMDTKSGKNIIHRIVGTTVRSDGTIEYITRGDANNSDDSFRPTLENIVGKYTGAHIPFVGSFVLFMQSSIGMITIFSLLYCLIMMEFFSKKIDKAQNDRLAILSEVIDYSKETKKGFAKANYVEHIYYKGYEYLFNENGFVDKVEIKDGPYLEKSDTSIIKVIDDGSNQEVISKEVIDIQDESNI